VSKRWENYAKAVAVSKATKAAWQLYSLELYQKAILCLNLLMRLQ
jgi:hypothetical protein